MKKSLRKIPTLYISLIILSTTIFSCKNSSIPKLEYNDQETIKEEIKNLETEISWTNEIEEGILAIPVINDAKYSSANVNPTPDLLKLDKYKDVPVYPELEGFGSLDIRNLKPSIQETVQNFVNAFSTDIYSGPENYFDAKYRFNYIFFRNDFITQWKKYFNKDFPYSLEKYKEIKDTKENNKKIIQKQKEIEKAKKEAEEKNEELPEEIKNYESEELKDVEEIKLFTDWIIGQPFIGPDITSLPLRFYCQEGTIDVTLYISNKNKNPIYQITIDRWGNKV